MRKHVFAWLFILLLMIPNFAGASEKTIEVKPGDTFELQFTVSDNPNYVASASGKLVYDHDAFELIPSDVIQNDDDLGLLDSTGIQLGYPISVSFKVLSNAFEDEYEFKCRITSQKDVNMRTTDGLKIDTIKVNVKKSSFRPNNVHSAKEYGFQSYVGVDVTFSSNGQIDWIEIGENPDFGEERGVIVKNDEFEKQFVGKQLPMSLDNIDGYTGATVIADAVIRALNKTYENNEVANKKKAYVETQVSDYAIWNNGIGTDKIIIKSITVLPPKVSFTVLPDPGKTVNIFTSLPLGKGGIQYQADINNPLEVIGEARDSNGVKWFQVRFKDQNGNWVIGFVKAEEVFLYKGWCGTSNFYMQYSVYSSTPAPSPTRRPTPTPRPTPTVPPPTPFIFTAPPITPWPIYIDGEIVVIDEGVIKDDYLPPESWCGVPDDLYDP